MGWRRQKDKQINHELRAEKNTPAVHIPVNRSAIQPNMACRPVVRRGFVMVMWVVGKNFKIKTMVERLKADGYTPFQRSALVVGPQPAA